MTETAETLFASLGEQLKQARETLNLSIDDVAQKTNLKKAHIEAFENDIFILQNVPPAFVRGYVRNYVRFLRLPESLIAQANYGEVSIPKEVKKAAPIKVANNHKTQKRWVKILTWLILLCAAGMTLAWWWQEHQKDEMSRAEIVSTTEVNTPDNNQSSEVSLAPVAVEAAPQAVEMSQNIANNEPVVAATPIEATAPTTEPSTPVAAEILNANAETAQPQTETTTEEATATTNGVLRIEIVKGQSWITVKGSKSKRSLAEKLYVAGDVLTFDDADEQYRLTIGAPIYVKVYYKGQEIPMQLNGKVARIKLPQ